MKPDILRVAAYCRVSSDSADQLHSYATQIRAYTEMIRQHQDWQLVDIYADEGLTGTRMDKREEFQRMMADCRKGKIDRILVKSISRFARNTKDCLTAIRELSSLGVSVLFEEDHMDTETLTTELMVSVSGALAQQESISISQNQRISYRRRMEKGEFITCKAPFGYRLTDGKHMEIVPEEARWVQWIFASYTAGASMEWLANQMMANGLPSPDGSSTWGKFTIYYILTNEKYIGDARCQKTFTSNFPFVQIPNRGQQDSYYTENTHPAIISKEIFAQAQSLRCQRAKRIKQAHPHYPLRQKIRCGNCGSYYRRRVTAAGHVFWVCGTHNDNASACPSSRIAEQTIYTAFIQMYYKLKAQYKTILYPMLEQLHLLETNINRGNSDVLSINEEIAQVAEQSHKVSKLQSSGALSADVCIRKQSVLQAKLSELHTKRRNLLRNDRIEALSEQIMRLSNILEHSPKRLLEFDSSLFNALVDHIRINSTAQIEFHLYGEIVLIEELEDNET
jgi:DNA invertase Pin-like site-specific DNA recombinase